MIAYVSMHGKHGCHGAMHMGMHGNAWMSWCHVWKSMKSMDAMVPCMETCGKHRCHGAMLESHGIVLIRLRLKIETPFDLFDTVLRNDL